MIVINEINHHNETNHLGVPGGRAAGYHVAGQKKIDVRLTIYPDHTDIKVNNIHTANQLILNELLISEFNLTIHDLKNHYPEHFV